MKYVENVHQKRSIQTLTHKCFFLLSPKHGDTVVRCLDNCVKWGALNSLLHSSLVADRRAYVLDYSEVLIHLPAHLSARES